MNTEPKRLLSFKLSAPGKVILFGEHSVVHYKPAIAATLDLRTRLRFAETSSRLIRLHFPSIDVKESFPIDQVRRYFSSSVKIPWEEYFKTLTGNFERFCSDNKLNNLTDCQRLSLITFFHIFSDLPESCPGFDLHIDSDLAIGSGVGSSASFSVVVSAAFHVYWSMRNAAYANRKENGLIEITEDVKKIISEASLSCEKIIHGNPSGIDHSTVLHGSMLEYVKAEAGSRMTHVECSAIRILLVNTNVSRSTKLLVEKVLSLKAKHSYVVENVLEAMGAVARSALQVLQDLKTKPMELDQLETTLGELITINHGLLRVLGVSHASLEKICAIANDHGFSAKMTGAGGGGYGFVYIPSNADLTAVQTVKQELTAVGFSVTEATLGGPGLIIDEVGF